MFTPTPANALVTLAIAVIEYDAATANINNLPLNDATGTARLTVSFVTKTLEGLCVHLAVFHSENAAKSFFATISIG